MKNLLIIIIVGLLSSCNHKPEPSSAEVSAAGPYVEVHSHRGDRGNFPENSIPAFISALEKGVDVLEMDVVISADSQVVVSHEPYMGHLFMLKPSGDSIRKAEAESLNLFRMEYDSIRTYDGGSKLHPDFPAQKKLKTYKPLLAEVIDTVEALLEARKLPKLKYNIEIKSKKKFYGTHQPSPEDYSRLVMQVLEEKGITDRVYIQSFDTRVLNFMNEAYPQMQLSYLVTQGDLKANLEKLSFVPDIYSPQGRFVSDSLAVQEIRQLGMQLVPWSTDAPGELARLVKLEVDGIISDFPEEALRVRDSLKLKV